MKKKKKTKEQREKLISIDLKLFQSNRLLRKYYITLNRTNF